MRGVLLLVVVALLLAPAAAAQPRLQGEVTSAAVRGAGPVAVDGQGLFFGFAQLDGQPDLGWALQGASLLVDVSTYTVSTITPAKSDTTGPEHATASYTDATVEPALSTKPAANAHEFWLMVTPLQSDRSKGFHVQGELPTGDLAPLDRIYYTNDAKHPAPESSPGPQDGSGVVNVQYKSLQPVLEWKPAAAQGVWTLAGDFVLTIYQADFQVTGADGKTDHYSTGDDDPGFSLTNPVNQYKEVRADLTVHGGTLTLRPNGRALQADFAHLGATAHGGLDFVDAHGSLDLATGPQALDGQVHFEADAIHLALAPSGDRVASQFSGTLRSVAVDGQAVPISAATLVTSTQAEKGLLAGIVALFTVAAGAFTVLAVRKKTDQALLLARAQAFFEVGRYRAALRASRRLLRLHPGDVDATTMAAMSLVRLGRPADAKPLLEKGLRGEHQGLLCMVEALVLYHQGNPALAAQRLQDGFNRYPALHDELAAVDLLDQLLLQAADSPKPSSETSFPNLVSP